MSSATLTAEQMPGSAQVGNQVGLDSLSRPHEDAYGNANDSNKYAQSSLRQALRSSQGVGASTPKESTSEEEYDDERKQPVAVLLQKGKQKEEGPGVKGQLPRSGSSLKIATASGEPLTPSDVSSETDALDAAHHHQLASLKGAKVYTVASDDKELRDILKRGMLRVS